MTGPPPHTAPGPGADPAPGPSSTPGPGPDPDAGDADPDPHWKPVLARSVVFRYDRVRDTDLLVLPERVVVLQGNAGSILRLCDGATDVGTIVATLTARHPGAPVAAEVPAFLRRLRAEGWLK